jgi:formylglycine-generating enzyme
MSRATASVIAVLLVALACLLPNTESQGNSMQEQKPPATQPKKPAVVPETNRAFRNPATGTEFVLVKGGCYQMGDIFGNGSEFSKPAHEVCVDDFYMAATEVTVGNFRSFVEATSYRTEVEQRGCSVLTSHGWEQPRVPGVPVPSWKNPGFPQDDRHPVVCVSWDDASAYIKWLRQKSRKRYRLPTEAEWEYAARSEGKPYKFSWGKGSPSGNVRDASSIRAFPVKWDRKIWWHGYDDGYVFTAPVGSFRPNELGLYDMTGNASEWCSDWVDDIIVPLVTGVTKTPYYRVSPRKNPQGTPGLFYKAYRGGSWAINDWTTSRNGQLYNFADNENGFRLALSVR